MGNKKNHVSQGAISYGPQELETADFLSLFRSNQTLKLQHYMCKAIAG